MGRGTEGNTLTKSMDKQKSPPVLWDQWIMNLAGNFFCSLAQWVRIKSNHLSEGFFGLNFTILVFLAFFNIITSCIINNYSCKAENSQIK